MAKFIMYVMAAFFAVISIPSYAAGASSSLTASNGSSYELSEVAVTHLRPGEKAYISDSWCGKPVYSHWFHFDITCTSAKVVEATEAGIRETGGVATTKTRFRQETAYGATAMIAMLLAIIFATAFFRQTTKFGQNITAMLFMFSSLIATVGGSGAIVHYGMSWTLFFAPTTFVAGMVVMMSGDIDGKKPNKKALYWAAAIFEALMALFLILVW